MLPLRYCHAAYATIRLRYYCRHAADVAAVVFHTPCCFQKYDAAADRCNIFILLSDADMIIFRQIRDAAIYYAMISPAARCFMICFIHAMPDFRLSAFAIDTQQALRP